MLVAEIEKFLRHADGNHFNFRNDADVFTARLLNEIGRFSDVIVSDMPKFRLPPGFAFVCREAGAGLIYCGLSTIEFQVTLITLKRPTLYYAICNCSAAWERKSPCSKNSATSRRV